MKNPLHLAFFGPSLISTFWNGAAIYHRGILQALAARGHRVTVYEPDISDRQRHRDFPDPDWAQLVVYPTHSRWSVLNAVEEARGADVVLKCGNIGLYDDALENGVLELKSPHTLVLYWDTDAPATIERLHHNPHDAFRPLLRRFDAVLTTGGAPSIVEAYEALGAVECVPLYHALDPQSHFPVPRNPRYTADLSFLGHRLPDRENRVDEFFLNTAARLPERTFLLGGDGWHDCPLRENVRRVGPIDWAERNAFHATPAATLVLNRACLARYGDSPPTRLFEATGSAACVITNDWPGVEKFLDPDREVLIARDGAEVAHLLETLKPERAAAIAEAARRRVLADHTFAHRARQLEDLCAELMSRRTIPALFALVRS